MCRMAAYLGPVIPLYQLLIAPSHSLVAQSCKPRELQYAIVNADGYGVGWYQDGAPLSYVQPTPIWSDPNLDSLCRSLQQPLWLANVRSATPGLAVNHVNTQPFRDNELLFMHNGFIDGFSTHLRQHISRMLDNDIVAGINGTTDSEYLFACIRQQLKNDADLSIEQAIRLALAQIESWLEDNQALLNIIITDGNLIYATRHAINHDCPSLYYTTDDEDFSNGQLIASEPLTHSEFWLPVPEHHLLVLERNTPASLQSL